MTVQKTSRKGQWTILKLLNWSTSYFQDHDIDNPKSTSEILLSHALNLRRIDLYLQYDRPLNHNELSEFKGLVKRRLNREPVAYIVGNKEFWSMPFTVTKDVLIPRPETECLVEAALGIMNKELRGNRLRVLDLGTGSGAIVLALASQNRGHDYYASDRSKKAVSVAKTNACHHGLGQVLFFIGDWMAPLHTEHAKFDVIVSNPPYIPSHEITRLQPEIYRYEPLSSLDADIDGLKCLKHIIENAWIYLNTDGYLIMEIGYDQKDGVTAIAASVGKYDQISVSKDYGGHDRILRMRRVSTTQ